MVIFKWLRFRSNPITVSNSKTVSNALKICTRYINRTAALVIKRVQRVLPKLHAKRGIIRKITVTYGTLQKTKELAC